MASAGSGGAARRRAVAPGLHALVMGGGAWPLVRAPRVPRRQRPQSRRDDRALPALSRALRRQSRAPAGLRREPRHLRQGRHEAGPAGLRAPLRGRPRCGRARSARRQREHPRRHDRIADRSHLPHVRPRRRASRRHRGVHRTHLVRRTQLRRLQDRAPGAARQDGPRRVVPSRRDDRSAACARVRPRSGGRRPRDRTRRGSQQEARRAGRRGRSAARAAQHGPAKAPARAPAGPAQERRRRRDGRVPGRRRRVRGAGGPTRGRSVRRRPSGDRLLTAGVAGDDPPETPPADERLYEAVDGGDTGGARRAARRAKDLVPTVPRRTAGCNRGCTCARCA